MVWSLEVTTHDSTMTTEPDSCRLGSFQSVLSRHIHNVNSLRHQFIVCSRGCKNRCRRCCWYCCWNTTDCSLSLFGRFTGWETVNLFRLVNIKRQKKLECLVALCHALLHSHNCCPRTISVKGLTASWHRLPLPLHKGGGVSHAWGLDHPSVR